MNIKDIAVLMGVLAGIYANLAFQDSLAAGSPDESVDKRLHSPSSALLNRERLGRVTIYDGIKIGEVDRALDTQFDRIDAMMFVRTRYPAPDGSLIEDDDCD